MQNKALLSDKQIETLLRAGPELDKLEPFLSPELRGVLVELQRNAAESYAAGNWQVSSTGEMITVPESSSRRNDGSLTENAQTALGSAYLEMADKSKIILKSLMHNLALNPSAPLNSPREKGRN